jgi:hypothetical protein
MDARIRSRTGPRAFATTAIAATTLALLLLAALPAQAGEKYYEGNVQGAPGKIEFVLKRSDGKLRINDFHADALITSCPSGVRPDNFGIRHFKVNRKRRFDVEKRVGGPRSDETAIVKGSLRRGGRASGTLRLVSGFDGIPICDTGTVDWKASH